jgi:hypothetical protein
MRQDQNAVMFTCDGIDLGVWDKLSGGEIDSEETKYRPGGMGAPITLGGSIDVGTLTLSRLYMLGRDHDRIHWLIGRAGRGVCTVSRQPLDSDGNAYGRPIVYTGTLKSVNPGEIDSESSDALLLECEVTPAGTVA